MSSVLDRTTPPRRVRRPQVGEQAAGRRTGAAAGLFCVSSSCRSPF